MLDRWLRTTTRIVTLLCAAMVVTACGGGSDGVGSGGFLGDQSPDVAPPAYLVELETTDSAGLPSKRFTKLEPLTVTVTLYDVDGDVLTPVADEIINLDSSLGSIDPSNGSTLTDDNGQAIFYLTADDVIGAGVVTATFTSEEDETFSRSQNVEILPAAGGTTGLALELFDPAGNATTELTADEPVTARVTLTSAVENFSLANRIVSLESDIANVSPANGNTLTNDEGVAEFLLTFSGTLGAGTVTASFSTADISLLATAVLESTSLELEKGLTLTLLDSAGNASNTLSESSPLTVRVALTDAEGAVQDIDDELITLTTELGSVSPDNGSALTDGGVAEFTLRFDGSVGAGVVTAAYETEQGTLEQSTNIEAQAEGTSNYVLSLSRSSGSITPTNPVTVTVNLRSDSASGPAVAGELVSLSSSVSGVSPGNGTVVTDSSGNATFILLYDGTEGAGVVAASYTSEEGNTFTNSINVTASQGTPLYSIRITQPTSGQDFDESGVDVIVNVAASASLQSRALVVSLSSDVGIIEPDNGQALTDSSGNARFRLIGDGTTGAGFLTASFTDADGNVYEDLVSVTMNSTGLGGGGGLPSKIVFVSATPETIALKGSGGGTGISEQSAIVFKVSDSTEEGVGGQDVTFSLSTDLGGVALQSATGTSDAGGNVIAIVNSGTLPTPVRVEASTVVDQLGEITALSPVLNVSSGVPVNSRFSLFYSDEAGECGALEGITCTELVVVAFDRFGNPAVDGTVVNAVTNCGGVGSNDGGQSSGACIIGEAGFGRCTLTWLAGGMNPTDYRQCADGSPVEVMAYTLGEENFIDVNGNAYFDALAINPVPANPPSRLRESSLETEGEPYLDENGSGVHEAGEFFVDWNQNGTWDAVTTSPDDLTARPGPYPKAPPANPPEADDDLLPYGYVFYNGTACAERSVTTPGNNPITGSPNIAEPLSGNVIQADSDDCSEELIYVWDTIDPTF